MKCKDTGYPKNNFSNKNKSKMIFNLRGQVTDKLKELKDSSTSEESLTLEQTQTINEFNKKIFNNRKDLREVQRELGESIKKLETK